LKARSNTQNGRHVRLMCFIGRVPLAHIPIAHIHSHGPVLRVFPLDHQLENFILN